jgi:hypothetical protein
VACGADAGAAALARRTARFVVSGGRLAATAGAVFLAGAFVNLCSAPARAGPGGSRTALAPPNAAGGSAASRRTHTSLPCAIARRAAAMSAGVPRAARDHTTITLRAFANWDRVTAPAAQTPAPKAASTLSPFAT